MGAPNNQTTFQVVFLFAIPTGSNLLRPPVCREQTGTAPLARQGEYQDDTSSTQESRLGRSEATPDRARYMDVPSQSGGCTTKHQNHLFRWFCYIRQSIPSAISLFRWLSPDTSPPVKLQPAPHAVRQLPLASLAGFRGSADIRHRYEQVQHSVL